MPVELHQNDPALHLWKRIDPSDLELIWDLFDDIPVGVGKVAQRLGLSVQSCTLPVEISGLIRKLSSNLYEIQVNNTDTAVRQRFTVSHEIAHYLLHRNLIDADGITDNILYRSKLSSQQETEANRLGAAILLPWTKVINWHITNYGCPPNKLYISEIAAAFRTSTLAVGFRLGI